MHATRRRFLLATGAMAMLAGCTSADDDGDEEPDLSGDVNRLDHDGFGSILVGPDGMTLYMFDEDTQDEASVCYDECAQNWPALTVDGDPSSSDGVDAELSTFERDDGEMQVAANGWPLYYFGGDGEMGDVDGQAVNDVWWVLDAGGARTTTTPAPDRPDGPY